MKGIPTTLPVRPCELESGYPRKYVPTHEAGASRRPQISAPANSRLQFLGRSADAATRKQNQSAMNPITIRISPKTAIAITTAIATFCVATSDVFLVAGSDLSQRIVAPGI